MSDLRQMPELGEKILVQIKKYCYVFGKGF